MITVGPEKEKSTALLRGEDAKESNAIISSFHSVSASRSSPPSSSSSLSSSLIQGCDDTSLSLLSYKSGMEFTGPVTWLGKPLMALLEMGSPCSNAPGACSHGGASSSLPDFLTDLSLSFFCFFLLIEF